MSGLMLPGLDGSNPLGFLSALGVLRVVTEHNGRGRLSWSDRGIWNPILSDYEGSLEALAHLLREDQRELGDDPALALEYDGERDLKPPPKIGREYLANLAARASANHRRSVDWAAAFLTDIAEDNTGKTKPTALHFTAGQQKFLVMARELQQFVEEGDYLEALSGPWTYSRPLPVLGWDATSSRDYALRAGNPSLEKKLGVPGADWLALRGLAFLATVPRGAEIMTPCCSGKWKSGLFQWPLWEVSLTQKVVESTLRMNVAGMSSKERQARGIPVVFECSIRRSDQGGYGSFSPSRPLPSPNRAGTYPRAKGL